MLRRLARPVARRSGAGAAQAPNRARVRWAQAGRRRVVPGGPGGGGERRQAPPGRHGREQARALRGIREADELRRRGQLRHLHRRDTRREGAPEPKDGRRESLPEEETGVMEADLPDDRREQGELRQGCRSTAAPVEEMIEQSFMHIRWTDSMRCDPVPCTSVEQRCVSRQQVTDNLHVQLLFTPKMNRRGTLLPPLLASVTNLFLANP